MTEMNERALTLRAEEPALGPWAVVPAAELAARVVEAAGSIEGRPLVVAVDGRGGSGKTTVAELLCTALTAQTTEAAGPSPGPEVPRALTARFDLSVAVVHTDDVAWWEPYFEWGHLLRDEILAPARDGRDVDFTPPAWGEHGRTGSIRVPEGTDVLVVEGTGAAQGEVADLVDVVVWVQADWVEAERRGLERDVAEGVNGDERQAKEFWDDWMGTEIPFLARERPWERAHLAVCGTPGAAGLAPTDGEVALAETGGGDQE